MNIRPDLRMSKAAFLDWDAGEGQRCELVVSQDSQKAWLWSRTSASAQFAAGPKVITEAEAVVPIAGLQLELPVVDIYAGTKIG